jgi:hypothetical protein
MNSDAENQQRGKETAAGRSITVKQSCENNHKRNGSSSAEDGSRIYSKTPVRNASNSKSNSIQKCQNIEEVKKSQERSTTNKLLNNLLDRNEAVNKLSSVNECLVGRIADQQQRTGSSSTKNVNNCAARIDKTKNEDNERSEEAAGDAGNAAGLATTSSNRQSSLRSTKSWLSSWSRKTSSSVSVGKQSGDSCIPVPSTASTGGSTEFLEGKDNKEDFRRNNVIQNSSCRFKAVEQIAVFFVRDESG